MTLSQSALSDLHDAIRASGLVDVGMTTSFGPTVMTRTGPTRWT